MLIVNHPQCKDLPVESFKLYDSVCTNAIGPHGLTESPMYRHRLLGVVLQIYECDYHSAQ